MLGKWSLTDWERIFSESVVTGFKKCCILMPYMALENNFL
jgi:hypothetical protein